MPRKQIEPKYRLHKARGCAVVTIDGKNHYLGPYGSPESHDKCAKLIREWRITHGVAQKPQSGATPSDSNLTVAELVLAYWKHAQGYYVKGGKPTGHLSVVKSALRFIRRYYGNSRAADFGPLALQALQEQMVQAGLSRGYINGHVRRIRLMFRWAVSKELLTPTVLQALESVDGLKKGRTAAREPKRVKPVTEDVIEATLGYLPPIVADMVRFQRLTGCRPGEVCALRPCDVERSGDVWAFRIPVVRDRTALARCLRHVLGYGFDQGRRPTKAH
jgi:integrase